MAKIPLTAVPGAPETVRPLLTELPTPNVTYAQPAETAKIQYPGPISVSPVQAKMQETTNFEGHIRGLQQREMNAPHGALFAANTAIGQSLMSVGQEIGQAGVSIGFALQQSKDQGDVSRGNNLWTGIEAAFAEDVAKNNITSPHQQLALFESKYVPMLKDGVSKIGMSAYSADRVMPRIQANLSKARADLLNKGNIWQAEQDQGAIVSEMESAAASGDLEAQLDANTRLTLARGQSPMQEAQRRGQILEAHKEWQVKELISDNPKAAFEEMEEIEQTGTSDAFPDLKDPSMVTSLKNQARTEKNNREQDALQKVSDGIIEGKIKNRNDIIAEGHGNLTASTINSLEEALVADPAFNTKSISEIKTLINKYNPQADDAENMTQYHAIMERIRTEVPRTMQGNLNADLYAISQKAVEKGQNVTPKQHFQGELETHIERLGKLGFFDPEGYSTQTANDPKETAYALEHRGQEEQVWQKIERTKGLMRQWLNDNPDADETKAMKYLQELVGPDVRAASAKEWKAQKEESSNLQRSLRGGHNTWIEPFNPKPTIVPTEDLRKKLNQNERSYGTYGPTSGLSPDLTERLSVLEEAAGRPLKVISGYRSPEKNKAVGGAEHSEHLHGNAVDIDTGDWSKEEKLALIEKASAAGITGIGVYNNNLHFDVGKRRAWGPSYGSESVPDWARATIARHEANGFAGLPMPSSVRKAVPQDLVNTVKVLEGYSAQAYEDSGRYSIGYGTKARPGETLSREQAESRLRSELTVHAGVVDRAARSVGLQLTPGQRNALISFDFNTGSAKELITSAGGDIEQIARRLPTWNKLEKGGPPSRGLTNRRNAELKMFAS